MCDETYKTIVAILKGHFDVKTAERTRVQRTAIVHLWRNRNSHQLDEDGKTLCDGKKVLRESEMETVIRNELSKSKGSGSKKLKGSLESVYAGLSEVNVL